MPVRHLRSPGDRYPVGGAGSETFAYDPGMVPTGSEHGAGASPAKSDSFLARLPGEKLWARSAGHRSTPSGLRIGGSVWPAGSRSP